MKNDMKNMADLVRVIDPTLIGSGHENQMLSVLTLAIRCTQTNSCSRPTSHQVRIKLENMESI